MIYIPAFIIGYYVYFKRLPIVLRSHADISYIICKAWAGLQGIGAGWVVWGVTTLLVALFQ